MKFVIFGADSRLGAVVGEDRILDLQQAAAADGGLGDGAIFASLLSCIESGDRGLDATRRLLEKHGGDGRFTTDLAKTKLQPPFPGRRLGLAGSNNPDHVANAMVNQGKATTREEVLKGAREEGLSGGFWVVCPPVGPDAKLPFPVSSDGLLDFEGEVAVVLGKGGKRVKAENWMERVWGTTLLIDWSIRKQMARSARQPFYSHKIFDGSKSLGPWICVDEVDPLNCMVETKVNGKVRQHFNNGDMIHTYAEVLEYMSQDLTIFAGDVLSGGTGAGTVVDSTPQVNGKTPLEAFLKVGDVVEVSAPNLGVLRGQVVESDKPQG